MADKQQLIKRIKELAESITEEEVEGIEEIERLSRDLKWILVPKRSAIRVTVEEAADRMDASEAFVRAGLKQNKFGFGTSYSIGNSSIDTAYIDRFLFEKYMRGELPYNLRG